MGVACFAGGLALTLSAAAHFGYIPEDFVVSKLPFFSDAETDESPLLPQIADDPNTISPTPSETEATEAKTAASLVEHKIAKKPKSSKRRKSGRPSASGFEASGTPDSDDSSDGVEPSLNQALDSMADIEESAKSPMALATGPSNDIAVNFDREKILDDYDNRISDPFDVPAGLRDRVGFWFDVYTKYDDNHRIIHNSKFPWIVYKVVDVSPIINSDTPRRRWMRNEKADKFVKAEAEKIRAAIHALAHRAPNMSNEYEKAVSEALAKLGGTLKRQASAAAGFTRVQVGQKNFFSDGLEVSPRYLSGMEEIFREHKLPIELTRIPFVESSFNKHATSKVGASGVWQFMGGTGRKFMIVNDHIDERRSPFKATEGAARLLKENHLILHRSWPLAITAWNHGPPGVRKAMAASGSRDLAIIISKYRSKSFDFASSNFFSEFLAALHAERYSAEIFGSLNREKAWSVHSVRLARSVLAKELLKKSGLSQDTFVALNPDLTRALERNVALPVGFRLMVTDEAIAGLERLIVADSEAAAKAKSKRRS